MGVMKKGFLGVMAAFAISAVTPILIPFALDSNGNLNSLGYVAGVMFWAGLVLGCAGYALLYRKERGKITGGIEKRKLPSALCFFSNRPAKVTDGIMIAAIIGTIFCAVNVTVNQIAAAVFLLLALEGVYAHFLLNGKMYQYIWNSKPNDKDEQLNEGKE